MTEDKRNESLSSVVERITESMDSMSKGQKAIAKYILANYETAAYMTAAKLGETTGVSESTVVRFSMELGYEGYPHFQKALQEELKVKLTSVQRLNAASRFSDDASIVKSILQADIDSLKYTYENMDEEAFSKAVSTILAAKKIYIMGLRRSSPLSSFMHFYMTLLFDDVVHINLRWKYPSFRPFRMRRRIPRGTVRPHEWRTPRSVRRSASATARTIRP